MCVETPTMDAGTTGSSDSGPQVETTDSGAPPESMTGSSRCGDGMIELAEVCDDGNATAGDGCSDQCVVEPGWVCTDGFSVCTAFCGDGVVVGNEVCDLGMGNSDTQPGACRTSCTAPRCGDGVKDPGEQCDEGIANAEGPTASCTTQCTLPPCQPGVSSVDCACTSDSDCSNSAGYVCSGDAAVPGICFEFLGTCGFDQSCPYGGVCHDGRCGALPTECPCAPGQSCIIVSGVGVCHEECGDGCAEDQRCLSVPTGVESETTTVCVDCPSCAADDVCALKPLLQAQLRAPASRCVSCDTEGASCATGEVCVGSTDSRCVEACSDSCLGACVTVSGPGAQVEACVDCVPECGAEQLCIDVGRTGATPGHASVETACIDACNGPSDCGNGDVCTAVDGAGRPANICRTACDSDLDCPGAVCAKNALDGQLVCTPSCDVECGSGQHCEVLGSASTVLDLPTTCINDTLCDPAVCGASAGMQCDAASCQCSVDFCATAGDAGARCAAGICTDACDDDLACDAGYSCSDATCECDVQGCNRLDGKQCVNGRCTSECSSSGDAACPAGYTCDGSSTCVCDATACEARGQGFHCDAESVTCVRTCDNDEDCPSGASCGADDICYPTCAESSDCDTGYGCAADACTCGNDTCGSENLANRCNWNGLCSASCDDEYTCRSGYRCNGGSCINSCSKDSDCGGTLTCVSGICWQESCATESCVAGASCDALTLSCSNDCETESDCPGENTRCLSRHRRVLASREVRTVGLLCTAVDCTTCSAAEGSPCYVNEDCPSTAACVYNGLSIDDGTGPNGICARTCDGSSDCGGVGTDDDIAVCGTRPLASPMTETAKVCSALSGCEACDGSPAQCQPTDRSFRTGACLEGACLRDSDCTGNGGADLCVQDPRNIGTSDFGYCAEAAPLFGCVNGKPEFPGTHFSALDGAQVDVCLEGRVGESCALGSEYCDAFATCVLGSDGEATCIPDPVAGVCHAGRAPTSRPVENLSFGGGPRTYAGQKLVCAPETDRLGHELSSVPAANFREAGFTSVSSEDAYTAGGTTTGFGTWDDGISKAPGSPVVLIEDGLVLVEHYQPVSPPYETAKVYRWNTDDPENRQLEFLDAFGEGDGDTKASSFALGVDMAGDGRIAFTCAAGQACDGGDPSNMGGPWLKTTIVSYPVPRTGADGRTGRFEIAPRPNELGVLFVDLHGGRITVVAKRSDGRYVVRVGLLTGDYVTEGPFWLPQELLLDPEVTTESQPRISRDLLVWYNNRSEFFEFSIMAVPIRSLWGGSEPARWTGPEGSGFVTSGHHVAWFDAVASDKTTYHAAAIDLDDPAASVAQEIGEVAYNTGSIALAEHYAMFLENPDPWGENGLPATFYMVNLLRPFTDAPTAFATYVGMASEIALSIDEDQVDIFWSPGSYNDPLKLTTVAAP